MNCRSAEPLLSAFLEDDLSQKERRSLEAHILACRRCSLSVRELRATLELMQSVPFMETSPHFEEDLLARIRSGEALRPTVVEWLKGLLEPARLRPLFLAGAGACAVWIGVMLVNPNGVIRRANVADVTAPSLRTPGQSVATTPSLEPSKIEVASLAPPSAGTGTAQGQPNVRTGSQSSTGRAATPSGDALDETVWPTPASSQDVAIPNPGSRYDDQYITDQFFLERDLGGSNNPTITPVSDRPSDDVFITF